MNSKLSPNTVERISVDKWQYWKEQTYYQKELRDRALGLAPEMESAKHIAHLVAENYHEGDVILDAGCGAGHYIRSLQKHLGTDFSYTGVDITAPHIADARQIFAAFPQYEFLEADVRELPFPDGEFAVTICCNTVPHVPNAAQALRELARVTKRLLLVRMLVGSETVITKKALTSEMDDKGEPCEYAYTNIYSEDFVWDAFGEPREKVEFLLPQYNEDSIRAHYARHSKDAGALSTTRMIDGSEAKGYLILPWRVVKLAR